MRRLLLLSGLAALLLGAPASWALQCTQAEGMTEGKFTTFQHACYENYFNNSGGALSSGNVVVLDVTGSGLNNVTKLYSDAGRNRVDVDDSDGNVDNAGTYITTTTTTDSELVVGVVDDNTCANQSYCRVQVRGPRLVRCTGADAPVAGDAVGTSATAGACGDAANDADGVLGIALQATQAGNSDTNQAVWVYINPSGPDG